MKRLTKEHVLQLHSAQIDEFGGEDGIRDEALLDSALAAPFHTFGGQFLLKTVQQCAARLGFGIIANHPFVDGNKRTGAHAMLVMLKINGVLLAYTQEELYEMILEVAGGTSRFEDLLDWIVHHEL